MIDFMKCLCDELRRHARTARARRFRLASHRRCPIPHARLAPTPKSDALAAHGGRAHRSAVARPPASELGCAHRAAGEGLRHTGRCRRKLRYPERPSRAQQQDAWPYRRRRAQSHEARIVSAEHGARGGR